MAAVLPSEFDKGQDLRDEVRRAKNLDPEVWARWHQLHYQAVLKYARYRLATEQEAEDVASLVFLEAIKAVPRYQDRNRPILAWFYGIARNLVNRRLRDRKRETPIENLEGTPAFDELGAVLHRASLRAALEQIKEEHREVLILRFVAELSTREIAQLFDKSEAAVYSLEARALTAMRRELEK